MSFADSITSWEANLESWVVETEADVQALVVAINKNAAFTESQLASGLSWVAKEVPTIVPFIEQALSFATAVGAAANPEAALVITAAQEAIAALNAVAQAQNSGATTVQTLLSGYSAVKSAQASGASVAAAAAKSVTAPAA